MGITNFHKMIKEKYTGAFKKKWMQSYDHVYVDLNYVLHFCSYSSNSEDEVLNKLYNFFDNVLAELIPTKSLTVCSDGVAPLAKLILQRQRRLNVSRNVANKTNLDDNSFNTMLFTPGTSFMKNLKSKLNNYFKYIGESYNIKINYLDDETDEAELKLKYQLMENAKLNNNHTHIVVTNDADVVVMLTTLKETHNAFVFCRLNNQNDILSIGKLLDLHTDSVGCSLNPNYDFTLVSIMMGNDYLPKVRLADFEKLWTSYKEILVSHPTGIINNDLTLNYKFLVKMLYKIIELSKQKSLNIVTVRNGFSDMYLNYFDGLTWCLETYCTGKCKRYDYMYEYQESPHPLGLILNMTINKELLQLNKSEYPAINSALYAILVLPNFAKNLINKKYHKFMEKSEILYTAEKCKKCSEFYDEIKILKSDLTKTEAELDSDESDSETETKIKEIKNKNTVLSKKLTAHKKNHDKLTLKDIKTLISDFNTYCKH